MAWIVIRNPKGMNPRAHRVEQQAVCSSRPDLDPIGTPRQPHGDSLSAHASKRSAKPLRMDAKEHPRTVHHCENTQYTGTTLFGLFLSVIETPARAIDFSETPQASLHAA
jgi:hypothetical protein